MPVPKGPRNTRPMSIRDLARKLTREEQFARGNTADENDDDFHDEVYAPPRKGGGAMSLHEGAARMTANDLGVDPDLAAKAGPAAAKALGALSDANSAEDSAEKTRCIRRAQKHLRLIDPSRHGKLIQQIQARLLAAQGRGGDTEVAHVTPGELVLPPDLQTPELMSLLQDAAEARGIDISRLIVGSVDNGINPETEVPEFRQNIGSKYRKKKDETPLLPPGVEVINVTAKAPNPNRFVRFAPAPTPINFPSPEVPPPSIPRSEYPAPNPFPPEKLNAFEELLEKLKSGLISEEQFWSNIDYYTEGQRIYNSVEEIDGMLNMYRMRLGRTPKPKLEVPKPNVPLPSFPKPTFPK